MRRVLLVVLLVACKPKVPTAAFESNALAFEYPAAWTRSKTPPLVHPLAGRKPARAEGEHVTLAGDGGRIEVAIEDRLESSVFRIALELDRHARWGEAYAVEDATIVALGEHDWLRTPFRAGNEQAIEYATIDREHLYVVTAFGDDELGDRIQRSLRLKEPPQLMVMGIDHPAPPDAIARALDSTVTIVAASAENGRLRAYAVRTGIVVGRDGSVLTRLPEWKPGELFAIGRGVPLKLVCAGGIDGAKVQSDAKLALVKCDRDFDGKPAKPPGSWTPLANRAQTVRAGMRLWSLGSDGFGEYHRVGELAKIDGDHLNVPIPMSRELTGGPIVDDDGRLVGIVDDRLYRVQPIAAANDLIAIAEAGWTPRPSRTDPAIEPSVSPASTGIRIVTIVNDARTGQPITGALLVVLKPGVAVDSFDANRVDEQSLAWGRSNSQGELAVKQPVPPGRYGVVVVASGYEVLAKDGALELDGNTPPHFDPWGAIRLLPK